jgi:Pin2-interacting protein X1
MGLAERKDKRECSSGLAAKCPERIGHDPRNLTWSDDKNRFSYKHMTSLGWSDKSGIGGSGLSGNPNHIAVVRKLDTTGIGMARARKEGDDRAAGAGQAGASFEEVLRRLAGAASASPSPGPGEVAIEVVEGEKPAVARSGIA